MSTGALRRETAGGGPDQGQAQAEDQRRRPGQPRRWHRLVVVAALYLVSDIGFSFFWGAFGTILLGRGVSLERLAVINLLGIAYFARFLVGPVVDRYGSARFGHFRGWLIATQLLLVSALVALVPLDPVDQLPLVLALMVFVFLVSAFHDTAMGGLVVRLVPPAERGPANGVQSAAACVSIVIGSGGALLLYTRAGWSVTVAAVAAVFVLPLAVLARFREPPRDPAAHRPSLRTALAFFRHRRVVVWVLVVLPVFTLGVYLASALQAPMLLAAGWSLDQLALVQNTGASTAGMVAGLLAGLAVRRYGRRRSGIAAGLLMAASIAAMLPLAGGGGSFGWNAAAVVGLSVSYTAALTWVLTIAMDVSRPAFPATDFTAQVSVLGVLRLGLGSAGLALAGVFGFTALIAAAVLLSLAGTAAAVASIGQEPPVRKGI